MNMMMKIKPFATLVLSLLFPALILTIVSGCVKYSFRGALPSSIKTIAIPLFEDRSNWIGLQDKMTNDVINAFIDDNSLQVIENEDDSDLVLRATINSVSQQLSSVAGDETVLEEKYVVSVKVECYNRQTDKLLWNGTISDFGIVPGTGGQAEQDEAVNEATERIVAEILNRTVAAW